MTVSFYNTPWTTVEQYEYPNNWQEIKHGFGYWKDPIELIGEIGPCCYQAGYMDWRTYDPKHPKCGFCGKFVKAGNWWKSRYTNPCMNCNEGLFWN